MELGGVGDGDPQPATVNQGFVHYKVCSPNLCEIKARQHSDDLRPLATATDLIMAPINLQNTEALVNDGEFLAFVQIPAGEWGGLGRPESSHQMLDRRGSGPLLTGCSGFREAWLSWVESGLRPERKFLSQKRGIK